MVSCSFIREVRSLIDKKFIFYNLGTPELISRQLNCYCMQICLLCTLKCPTVNHEWLTILQTGVMELIVVVVLVGMTQGYYTDDVDSGSGETEISKSYLPIYVSFRYGI